VEHPADAAVDGREDRRSGRSSAWINEKIAPPAPTIGRLPLRIWAVVAPSTAWVMG
jgi:hypothetical protein